MLLQYFINCNTIYSSLIAIKAHEAQELINKKGSQIQEIIFTQCAVATLKKVHLTSLSNLKSIQIQFVKSRIPQETIKQFSKLTQLSRLKFWDLPQGCGADVVQECKNIKVSPINTDP